MRKGYLIDDGVPAARPRRQIEKSNDSDPATYTTEGEAPNYQTGVFLVFMGILQFLLIWAPCWVVYLRSPLFLILLACFVPLHFASIVIPAWILGRVHYDRGGDAAYNCLTCDKGYFDPHNAAGFYVVFQAVFGLGIMVIPLNSTTVVPLFLTIASCVLGVLILVTVTVLTVVTCLNCGRKYSAWDSADDRVVVNNNNMAGERPAFVVDGGASFDGNETSKDDLRLQIEVLKLGKEAAEQQRWEAEIEAGRLASAAEAAAIVASAAADQCECESKPQPIASPDSAGATNSTTGERYRMPMCCICLDQPAMHVCVPCGHQCLCLTGGCKERIEGRPNRDCPVCKTKFTQIIRVFAA